MDIMSLFLKHAEKNTEYREFNDGAFREATSRISFQFHNQKYHIMLLAEAILCEPMSETLGYRKYDIRRKFQIWEFKTKNFLEGWLIHNLSDIHPNLDETNPLFISLKENMVRIADFSLDELAIQSEKRKESIARFTEAFYGSK